MELYAAAINRVVDSIKEAELGDPRRTRRLVSLVSKLAVRPQVSLPDAMGSESELEGAYRLVNNPKVTMDVLHEAHAKFTASRAREVGEVLAIHDTTPCQFSHADPALIGYLNTGKPGFYAHYALVVGADSRQPLGISSIETISRTQAPQKLKKGRARRKNRSGAQTRKKANREFERWQRGIAQTEDRLAGCEVIHIADRESDSYELMARCLEANRRFAFRARINHRNPHTFTL